ncbi:MAG: DUF2892 domain-containing protein [Pseudomonadota bacterium]
MVRAGYHGSIGRIDRLLRFVLGCALLGFATLSPWAAELGADVQGVSGGIGAVLIATASIRFYPLYRMLRICSS